MWKKKSNNVWKYSSLNKTFGEVFEVIPEEIIVNLPQGIHGRFFERIIGENLINCTEKFEGIM